MGNSSKRGSGGRGAPSGDGDGIELRGGCAQDRIQCRGKLVRHRVDSEKLWKPQGQTKQRLPQALHTGEQVFSFPSEALTHLISGLLVQLL